MRSIKQIIDLSTALGAGTRLFPGMEPVVCRQVKTHAQRGVQVSRVEMTVHSGTHTDAPLHFLPGADDITRVELEQVCGRAMLLDLRHLKPGSGMGAAELEKCDPGLKPGDIAIINTGYEHYEDAASYCWVEPDAARWLVEKQIKCLAMDILSTDPVHRGAGPAGPHTHPAHHILLGAGVILVECLVNLDALPKGPLFFVCMPLKLENCEASPARAAVIEFAD